MRRTKLVLAAIAVMAALLVAFAAPAMARSNGPHFFHGNGGIIQASHQDVESGDSDQTFNVTGGGNNSNQTAGLQGISNTGNAVNTTNVLQADSFDNGFDNGFFNDGFDNNFFDNNDDFFFDPFFDGGFNGGFGDGDIDIDNNANFEIGPSQTTGSTQLVDQAAAA
jgi:hypothetical protein